MLKYRPNILANVPTLYQMLLKDPNFAKVDKDMLDYVVSAAAPFPKESQEILEGIVGEGKLLEGYGMTETSPLSCANPSKGIKKLGTVGLPLPNVDLKLVDPDSGKEVPLGQPGEICVKGMIIVGGYKVFSVKVEDTLTQHPAIGAIATIGIPNPDRPGSEIVKAFIQIDPNYEYDGNEDALKDEILNFAKENCAPYEVPKIIAFTDELPLTSVGKVDKKSLRASK